MHLLRLPLFLTLVLCSALASALCVIPFSAQAAKAPPSPELDEASTENIVRPEIEKQPEVMEAITITPPPPAKPLALGEKEYFHLFRRGLTVRTGAVYSPQESKGKNTWILGGLEYLYSTEELNAYEAGADLFSEGSGGLHLARRFIYTRSRFRPYSKLGIGVHVIPANGLVSFLKYENYELRGAIGFEHLVRPPLSIRVELEASAAISIMQANINFGFVYGF